MTVKLESLLEDIQQVDTFAGLQLTISYMRDLFSVTHASFHWLNSAGEKLGASTYSAEWADHYLESGYLQVDPVILGSFQRFTPANWKQFDWSSKAAQMFFRDAMEHGLGNQGYSIPLRGPNGQFALFTVNHQATDRDWERFIARYERDFMLIAHELNKKALAFEGREDGRVPPSLSPRETSALTNLAQGKSRAQAAKDMGISENTLRVYIEGGRHKLGAMNTTHAVARALSIGLIRV